MKAYPILLPTTDTDTVRMKVNGAREERTDKDKIDMQSVQDTSRQLSWHVSDLASTPVMKDAAH